MRIGETWTSLNPFGRGSPARLAATAASFVLLALAFAGCVRKDGGPDGECTTPTASAMATAPSNPAVTPPPAVVIGIFDPSTSYNPSLLRAGIRAFTDRAVAAVVPGGPAIQVSGIWVSDASYAGRPAFGPLSLPTVGPLPTQSATSTPCARTTDNPNLAASIERENALAEEARQTAEAEKDVRFHDELERARTELESGRQRAAGMLADFARYALEPNDPQHLEPPVVAGSDYGGALCRAGDAFGNAVGSRLLVVIGDLEEYGQQDCAGSPLRLNGVAVVVLFHAAASASTAQELRSGWTERFQRAGASSVNFYTPDQLPPADLITRLMEMRP